MGKRIGRSSKMTTAEKLAIVNRYYITTSNGYDSSFGGHGIYRQLSEFAKTLGYNLEAYDFSRNVDVRELLRQLTSQSVQGKHNALGVPTYEPLDIASLMMTGRDRIERALRDREAYYLDLYHRAAKAIENYMSASQLNVQYQAELANLRDQNAELIKKNESLIAELRAAMKDVSYLKRIVRKDVEPELAQQYLESLSSREMIMQKVAPSVTTSINSLTADDQRIRTDAQTEIDMLDLNNLFK